MAIIDKNMPIMPFKVSTDRQCKDCARFNGKDWCLLQKSATRAINYGCKYYISHQKLEEQLKKEQAYLDALDCQRVNYMLTLMFAMVTSSYQIMAKGEAMLGAWIGGKEWRFDYAFPFLMIAVEVDGGVWAGGRHINPAGYINDMEKLNTAASMGWLVLRITTDDRFASKTYDLIKAAVEYRINES